MMNPIKGTVINVPNGPNVYEGVPKDYVGKEVTPKNFLKILSGQDMGPGKKTIRSGPNDRIFVYFADHGAPGLIAFPSSFIVIEHVLHAKDLIATIEQMYNNKQYKEMVFYIEACESGSMFNGLLKDEWNVYATTAANPYESSYACFDSKVYHTYLADCYSANFLVDTETQPNLDKVTLQQQYLTIKQQTNTSHVCQYGNMNMSNETLATFFGSGMNGGKASHVSPSLMKNADKIETRDLVERYFYKTMINNPRDAEHKKRYQAFKQQQLRADVVFGAFYHSLNLNTVANTNSDRCYGKSINMDCNKESVIAMQEHCGHFNEANLKYAHYITDACQMYSAAQISAKFKEICSVAAL